MGLKSKRVLFYFCLALLSLFYIRLIHNSLCPDFPKVNEVIFYSNQTKDDLRILFARAIDLSKKSIHLVMFGLSDPKLLHQLKNKAKTVPTKIFYDPKASPNLAELQATPVQEDHLMHQKILVVDQEYVFLGSANMTSSLSMHDNLVVGLHSPEMAKFLEVNTPYQSGTLQVQLGKQKAEAWLLPDPQGNALEAIKLAIREAKQEIRLAMYTFTHPLLIEELLHAIDRGVTVTVASDAHAAKGASKKALQKIHQGKAHVVLSTGLQLLHHKFVCVDQHTLIVGSANWTRSAFTNNRDAFLILHPLNRKQQKKIDKIWKEIIRESKPLDE